MEPSATKEHPLATTGSGRVISLHTARKSKLSSCWLSASCCSVCALRKGTPHHKPNRAGHAGSKASLASLGASSDSTRPAVSYAPTPADANANGSSSSTVVYYADSMLPTSTEPRIRTPQVGGAGSSKASGWVVAGYSVDYALDWAVVLVLGVILAASEAGVPRQGEQLLLVASCAAGVCHKTMREVANFGAWGRTKTCGKCHNLASKRPPDLMT